MKFYLTALGCKLNQAEVELLARQIEAAGHVVVLTPQEADWAIINTCTVTHVAAQKSRQLIRHLARANPALRIAVIGCYAEVSPGDVNAIENVSIVVPNVHKEEALERILAFSGVPWHGPQLASQPRRLQMGHTRAFVKIQDGCDNRCAYCIVCIARGPQRSRPPEQVFQEINARVAEGYQEAVLTGVNIGAYGQDHAPDGPLPRSAGWSLARLVEAVFEQTAIRRLRLTSIEPWDFTPELLELWANERLCRHVHLPLQSGCDTTLRRMGRKGNTADFERLVRTLRARVPEISITTDVIVGFPGETEEEFGTSYDFIERLELARLHVFKYSRRAGTPAAAMPDQVHPAIAQARSRALITLGRRMARAFHARFVGQEVEVLFESATKRQDALLWSGLTDNYLRIVAPSARSLANTFARVRCLSADESGLRGELCSKSDYPSKG